MTTDEKGNPLTYWGGLEKAIKITLEEAIENKIKGEIVETGFIIEKGYSEEDMISFGEFIFKNSLLTHTKGVRNLFKEFKNK
jgi:hypothetical protein